MSIGKFLRFAIGIAHYGYDTAGQLLDEDRPCADDTVSYTHAKRLRTSLSLAEKVSVNEIEKLSFAVSTPIRAISEIRG